MGVVLHRSEMYCDMCDSDIIDCSRCKKIFYEGDDCFCNEDGTHLCRTCTLKMENEPLENPTDDIE